MDIQRECTATCLQIGYVVCNERILIEYAKTFVHPYGKSNIPNVYVTERKEVVCDATEQANVSGITFLHHTQIQHMHMTNVEEKCNIILLAVDFMLVYFLVILLEM